MVKIDLGCGNNKHDGFLGVDRFDFPWVDIVADLDESFPIETDSVDLLLASHSLEHVSDLMFTMREIYRVCKHGAQICIVAPYNEQKLNIANPYHIHEFNEHTPRFWTDYATAKGIHESEYQHPHAKSWGLSKSDHSNPGLDIRLINMEFFYFPEYLLADADTQREMRSSRFDVCDQIIYHLIVWKSDELFDTPYEEYIKNVNLYYPEYVIKRRMNELKTLQAALQMEKNATGRIDEVLKSVSAGTDKLSTMLTKLDRDINESSHFIPNVQESFSFISDENKYLRNEVSKLYAEAHDASTRLFKIKESLLLSQSEKSQLLKRVTELESKAISDAEEIKLLLETNRSLKEEVAKADSELLNSIASLRSLISDNQKLQEENQRSVLLRVQNTTLAAELNAVNELLNWYKNQNALIGSNKNESIELGKIIDAQKVDLQNGSLVVEQVFSELHSYRSSRINNFIEYFRNSSLSWNMISPAFDSLKKYTKDNFKFGENYSFVLSHSLTQVPYIEYKIPFAVEKMSSISLAVRPLVSAHQGIFGVEVINRHGQLVTQQVISLSSIDSNIPTVVVFSEAISLLEENWTLRLFVRDTTVSVPVYEVIKKNIFRSRSKKIPFIVIK